MTNIKRVLTTISLFIVCIIALFFFYKNKFEFSKTDQIQTIVEPVEVLVTKIKNQDVEIIHELPARITAFKQSQVRPQIDGIITKQFFEEGSTVKQGEQLYQINDIQYIAFYNQAVADLKIANANLSTVTAKKERYSDLVKIDAVSQQEFDDVSAQFEQALANIEFAKSKVELAKINLDYTKVYAPISGKIGKSLVTEGALVTAKQAESLAVITQLDPVYVDIQQSSSEAILIKKHLNDITNIPVEVILDKDLDDIYPNKGTLKFTGVTVDETSGSISLRAIMPNPDGTLLPGLFVTAMLELGVFNLILIPQSAAIRGPDGELYVWIVKGNKAEKRILKSKYTYKNSWIVKNDVQEDEILVLEGYQKIHQNTNLNVVYSDNKQ